MDEQKIISFDEIFKKLSGIDVSALIKEKEGFSYVPWAKAWRKIVEFYPDATNKTHCDDTGFPCFVKQGIGAFCKTSVTIGGHTRSMELPVLNFANKAMKEDSYSYTVKDYNQNPPRVIEKKVAPLNSFEVNTTNKRCLVKTLAMFGFGIKLYAESDWKNQEDQEEDVAWETARTRKLGGKGKNAEKSWKELEGNTLLFYCDKEKNKYYSEKYAIHAQKELDWRAGMQEDSDFAHETKDDKPDPFKNMRLDIQAEADNILKAKWEKEIQYKQYTEKITNADTREELLVLSSRIKAIDELVKCLKKNAIDANEFKIFLIEIGDSGNGKLDQLVSRITHYTPDDKENRAYLDTHWADIEKLFTKLGYNDNPSLATNSMKKNLDTPDMYTIKDWHVLKEYQAYLETKLKEKENPVEKKETKKVIEPTITNDDNIG